MSNPANDDFSQHLSDDEESNHEDASATGAEPKQQQPMIPQTTAISNIKLPILKKEEYDIWAMEMEHYLEYIDNEVWKVIQNGNSKKRISIGKDGVVRVLSPVTAAEIQAVEKERKAKNILLMAIPKEHMRRFHGMDDAKEIWEAIRTRFGGNANSKKMQKAVFKKQFEAFKISNSEGLEKGYDRFQQLLSQLEAHGAEVSIEDANHKFLRSLPSAWSNLAMTMRTNPEIDNLVLIITKQGVDSLSFDDLYNNLRVFESDIKGSTASLSSPQNVAFVSENTSNTKMVCPSLDHERLELIDEYDLEEMDLKWQVAMISMRMKKFYKKTGRKLQFDAKELVGFDKTKVECYNCHKTGHFARECRIKGNQDNRRRDAWNLGTKDGAAQTQTQSDASIDYKGIFSGLKKVEAQLVVIKQWTLCLNHLIRDCDYHEKRMARKAKLNSRWDKKTSQKELRETWNNVQRVNKQNKFVPSAVLTKTSTIPVSTARASICTVGENGTLLVKPSAGGLSTRALKDKGNS
ncbi:ribonuclease H-like domain-containing protein [Tanacetum coccineum]